MEKNNFNLYAFIALLCSLILAVSSSIYTLEFFKSLGVGNMVYVSAAIGLCIDCGKYIFSYLTIVKMNEGKYGAMIVSGLLALICITISFYASITWDLNRQAMLTNEVIAGQVDQKGIDRDNKTKDSLSKELENLIKNKESIIKKSVAELQDSLKNTPKNWVSRQTEVSKEIAATRKQTRVDIDNRIAAINESLTKKNDSNTNIKKEFTEGIYNLAKSINEDDPNEALNFLLKIKNGFLEILGIAFSIAYIVLSKNLSPIPSRVMNDLSRVKNKVRDKFNETRGKLKPKHGVTLEKHNDVEDHVKKKTHDKSRDKPQDKTQVFNDVNMRDYLKIIYHEKKENNSTMGINSIIKKYGIPNKIVRGCKDECERKKVLEVSGNQTMILVDQDKAEKLLGL